MTARMILFSTNHPHLRFPGKEVFRTVKTIYKNEGKNLRALSVVCTNDRSIRTMNREFLAHDYSTDVIAFPFGSDDGVEAEIYINLDAARNQAKKYRVTYTQEARRLLIHGVLHILGYDDTTVQKKKKMTEREEYYITFLSRKARL
jgi:probable rRNA maturation factor